MGDIPNNKPLKNINAGDVISAKWLNKVKNGSLNVSASAPLFVTKNASGTVINHGEHGPAVRWGSVVSDYVWSDATFVEVYPMLYTEDTNGITSNIISTDDSAKIKVYVTNPIASDVSLVSDVTKNITLEVSDIISYMWFGDHCGTMMGAGGVGGTNVTPVSMYSDFEGSETAQSDTWAVSDQGAYDGVKTFQTTRLVYNDAGDEVVYGFYREYKYDSIGRLTNISGETRYTVDTPSDCS